MRVDRHRTLGGIGLLRMLEEASGSWDGGLVHGSLGGERGLSGALLCEFCLHLRGVARFGVWGLLFGVSGSGFTVWDLERKTSAHSYT